MSYFTFDTAWIVATMQNTCNEAVKASIRERLDEMIYCRDIVAQQNRQDFETFCWAWSRDCLDWHTTVPKWTVDPYPYKDAAQELLVPLACRELQDIDIGV